MVFTRKLNHTFLSHNWLKLGRQYGKTSREEVRVTNNQIRYFQLQEDTRHNIASETEQKRYNTESLYELNRSNVARERETERSNRARERETSRTNRANEGIKRVANQIQYFREGEQQRHNMASEMLQAYGHQTDRMRVDASYAQMASNERVANISAAANRYATDVNAATQEKYLQEQTRSNLAREEELTRSNKAREQENTRSNRARESETKRSNVASESTKRAAVNAQVRNAETAENRLTFDKSVYSTTGADLQKAQTWQASTQGAVNVARTVKTGVDTIQQGLNLVGTYGGFQTLLGGGL